MPALKDSEGHTASSMKVKEALVRKSAFPKSPANIGEPPIICPRTAHVQVTQEVVSQAFMAQAATKAPGPDKINFRILRMVWDWDKVQITNMVYHVND